MIGDLTVAQNIFTDVTEEGNPCRRQEDDRRFQEIISGSEY